MSYFSLLILKLVVFLLLEHWLIILFVLLSGLHSSCSSQNEGPFCYILVLEDLLVFPRDANPMLSILIESIPIGNALLFMLTFQRTEHYNQSNVVVPNHLIEICDWGQRLFTFEHVAWGQNLNILVFGGLNQAAVCVNGGAAGNEKRAFLNALFYKWIYLAAVIKLLQIFIDSVIVDRLQMTLVVC